MEDFTILSFVFLFICIFSPKEKEDTRLRERRAKCITDDRERQILILRD